MSSLLRDFPEGCCVGSSALRGVTWCARVTTISASTFSSLPTMKIAFLGPEGTYTHQAVVQEFGQGPEIECLPLPSIAACFKQINEGNTDYAVVPLENSTNGQVVFTYDLLRDWFISQTPNFSVVAEQFVSINHCVFSRASDLSKVDKLYSHPQVWGQVSEFLQQGKLSENFERVDCGSTAQAAEMVALDKTETSACISSRMGGERFGLDLVAENVEDLHGNTTRFLVLGKESPEGGNKKSEDFDVHEEAGEEISEQYITSFMFVLDADDPGALCSALNAFKENMVNLTSITSRPSKMARWEYVFFMEADGAYEEEKMQKSLVALRSVCKRVAVSGSFRRSWRYKGRV